MSEIYAVSHFVSGARFSGNSALQGPIYNPALGEQIGTVAFASETDVASAVDAAAKAYPSWAKVSPLKRARIMFRFKDLLEKYGDDLAADICREHGKTLTDARAALQRGLEVVEYACGAPQLLKGEITENVGPDIDSWGVRQPVGVCVGITPFNFPAMVPLWMFPMAIVCGNTFILKPSEKVPSAAIQLAELLTEAGLPDGVFNVVNGNKNAVDVLLTDPRIEAVSFVGSTPVAEYIYTTASQNGKRVQALGGAKNHAIVMPDANLGFTVDALMGAAYGSAGERCMATSVVVVVGDIGDKLVKSIAERALALKIGSGNHPDSEMGPLITREHLDNVRGYIETGVKEGADLVVDGRKFSPRNNGQGFFLGASLFDKVTPDMKIYREEIFGPVLSIVRAPTFEKALTLVNDHEYGNGATIFTQDGRTARTFANQVKAGMVGANVSLPVPMAYHSFGGWKRSRFGDLHMHGEEGVRFYTQYKAVTNRWPTDTTQSDSFAMPTMS